MLRLYPRLYLLKVVVYIKAAIVSPFNNLVTNVQVYTYESNGGSLHVICEDDGGGEMVGSVTTTLCGAPGLGQGALWLAGGVL